MSRVFTVNHLEREGLLLWISHVFDGFSLDEPHIAVRSLSELCDIRWSKRVYEIHTLRTFPIVQSFDDSDCSSDRALFRSLLSELTGNFDIVDTSSFVLDSPDETALLDYLFVLFVTLHLRIFAKSDSPISFSDLQSKALRFLLSFAAGVVPDIEIDDSDPCSFDPRYLLRLLEGVRGGCGRRHHNQRVSDLCSGTWWSEVLVSLLSHSSSASVSEEASSFRLSERFLVFVLGCIFADFGRDEDNLDLVPVELREEGKGEGEGEGEGESEDCILDQGLPRLSGRRDWHIVTFSTPIASSLVDMIQHFRGVVSTKTQYSGAELARAMNMQTGTDCSVIGPYRASISFKTKTELTSALSDLRYVDCHVPATPSSSVAFVFTGQIPSCYGVAQQLYESEPHFRGTFDNLIERFKVFCDPTDVRNALLGTVQKSELDGNPFPLVQLFIVEYCLSQMWQSWGLTPAAVLSHSDGEFCAAVVSGAMSLERAVRLIALRELVLEEIRVVGGAMCAVRLPVNELEKFLEEFREMSSGGEDEEEGEGHERVGKIIDIACENGRDQTVIAGHEEALKSFCEFLEKRKVKTRMLSGLWPFHSRMLDPAAQHVSRRFEKDPPELRPDLQSPRIPWYSSVLGRQVTDPMDYGFWADQMSKRVRYWEAVRSWEEASLGSSGGDERRRLFAVEMGPDAICVRFGPNCVSEDRAHQFVWLTSVRISSNSCWKTLLESLQSLYVYGGIPKINWEEFYFGEKPLCCVPDLTRSTIVRRHCLARRVRKYFEPIAILGASCHLPDGILRIEDLFDRLLSKTDALTETPLGRWDPSVYEDAELEMPSRAGYLRDPYLFDYPFFNLMRDEAAAIDPQGRIFLQLAWHALEDAGIPPSSLRQSHIRHRVGIVIGLSLADYHRRLLTAARGSDPWAITGNAMSAAAGRVAMFFGTEGPALILDSACSSSVTALHIAAEFLRTGECDLVIVGAGNLVLDPRMNVGLARAGMVSPDSVCRVFDAHANGYARSEGFGVVVLERFAEAKRKPNRSIRGTILSTHTSQAGIRPLITVPRSAAQAELMREGILKSGVPPNEIDLIEAHGTGTPLGDPTEIRAIGAVFRHLRDADNPIEIRSAKACMGHAETAAGMVGLFSVLEAFRRDVIPPQLHFKTLNPQIDLDRIPASILPEKKAWPRGRGKPRVAMVNSFGFTGSDATMILAAPDELLDPGHDEVVASSDVTKKSYVVLLSARNEETLERQQEALRMVLEKDELISGIADIAYTSTVLRDHFDSRTAIVATSRETLLARLTDKNDFFMTSSSASLRPLTFMFAGQASQYPGMSKTLYHTHSVFRRAFDECAALLKPLLTFDVRDLMMFSDFSFDDLARTHVSQPCIFAMQIALAALWRSWGVVPDVVVGHSLGEFAAAVVAGILSLEDASKLVAARGNLMDRLPRNGSMHAIVSQSETLQQSVLDEIRKLDDPGFGVAGLNARTQIVLSGDESSLSSFLEPYRTNDDFRVVDLRGASHAFHSKLMLPMIEEFRSVVSEIRCGVPSIPFVSTLRGSQVTKMDPEYWCDHILHGVQFLPALEEIVRTLGGRVFVEIGPHTTLSGLGRRSFSSEPGQEEGYLWLPSLRKNTDDWETVLSSLGQLLVNGFAVDWDGFFASEVKLRRKARCFPFYQFAPRQCVMYEIAASYAVREGTHPFLGEAVELPAVTDVSIFQSKINIDWPVFVRSHRISGTCVLSGSTYVSAVMSGMKKLHPQKLVRLRDIKFSNALVLTDYTRIPVQTIFRRKEDDRSLMDFEILSFPHQKGQRKDSFQMHVRGEIESVDEFDCGDWTAVPSGRLRISAVKQRCTEYYSSSDIYGLADKLKLNLGGSYRWIKEVFVGDDEVLGHLRLRGETVPGFDDPNPLPPDYEKSKGYYLHPGMVDACFQVTLTMLLCDSSYAKILSIPVAVSGIVYNDRAGDADPVWVYFRRDDVIRDVSGTTKYSLDLLNEAGDLIGCFHELLLREVTPDFLSRLVQKDSVVSQLFYRQKWKVSPLKLTTPKPNVNHWLVFEGQSPVSGSFCRQLGVAGRVVRVRRGEQFQQEASSSGTLFTVNPRREEDFQNLLSALRHRITGVVFFWALVPREQMDSVSERVSYVENVVIRSLFNLVRAFFAVRLPNYPRIWVLGEEIHLVTNEGLLIPSHDGLDRRVRFESAPLVGFLRSAALEHPELKPTLVDFSPKISSEKQLELLLLEMQENSLDPQIVYRRDLHTDVIYRFVPRLRRFFISGLENDALQFPSETGPYNLHKPTDSGTGPTQISKLTLQPDPETREVLDHPPSLAPIHIVVEVKACGLNFRDLLNLMNKYPDRSSPLGTDFAGVVVAMGSAVTKFEIGDSVFGITRRPGFSSHVISIEAGLVKLPPFLNFDQGASLPTVMVTAIHCLLRLADLKSSDTVLIHSAAGGVGLSAIHVAQHIGATILATAGTEKKREFLRGLGIPCVMNSRDFDDYGTKAMEFTSGRGVDVVLNSLTRDGFIRKNLEICAKGARFIEISKRNIWVETQVREIRKDVIYTVFAADHLTNREMGLLLSRSFQEFFPEGAPRKSPLPYVVFPMEDAIDVFRSIQQGVHIGKFVIRPTKCPQGFRGDSSYLLVGGFGGIGLEVAKWLVGQGCGTLVLMSRRDPTNDEQKVVLKELNSLGDTAVVALQGDISKEEDVRRILETIQSERPPLRGVFHSAGVLRDELLRNQSWENFEVVFASKIKGSLLLHSLTTELEMDLDYFVLFSSIVSVFGSSGQTNYAAANAFQDALVDFRRQCGLVATGINWGAWGEVGMAFRTGLQKLQRVGMHAMSPIEALQAMEVALRTQQPHLVIADVAWSTFVKAQPRLQFLLEDLTETSPMNSQSTDLLKKLNYVASSKRKEVMQNYLYQLLTSVMRGDVPRDFDENYPLSGIGVDSFSWQVVRNKLLNDLAVRVTIAVGDLMHYPTIAALSEHLLRRLTLLQFEDESSQSSSETPAVLPNMWYSYFVSSLFEEQNLHVLSAAVELASVSASDVEDIRSRLDLLLVHWDVFSMSFQRRDKGDVVVVPVVGGEESVSPFVVRPVSPRGWKKELKKEMRRPFDLTKPPLLRVGLFEGGKRKPSLLYAISHQIILDKPGLKKILAQLLAGSPASVVSPPPDFPVDSSSSGSGFLDVIRSYQAWCQLDDFDNELRFWEEKLSVPPVLLSLRSFRRRKRLQDRTIRMYEGSLKRKDLQRLQSSLTGDLNSVSPASVFLSAMYLLLFQESGVDPAIGLYSRLEVPNADAHAVGPLENLLPCIVSVDPEMSFLLFCQRVEEAVSETHDHRQMPFHEILSHLPSIPQDTSHHPLVQTSFRFERVEEEEEEEGESISKTKRRWDLEFFRTQLDLILHVVDDGGVFRFFLTYNEDLFPSTTRLVPKASKAKFLFDKYASILNAAVRSPPNAPVRSLLADRPKNPSLPCSTLFPIRGYLVDIGLVERILRSVRDVEDVVIRMVRSEDGGSEDDFRMVAFIQRARISPAKISIDEMLRTLKERLSVYLPTQAELLVADFRELSSTLRIRTFEGLMSFMHSLATGEEPDLLKKLLALPGIGVRMTNYVVRKTTDRFRRRVKSPIIRKIVEMVEERYVAQPTATTSKKGDDDTSTKPILGYFRELPSYFVTLMNGLFGPIAREMQLTVDQKLKRTLQSLLIAKKRVPDYMCPVSLELRYEFPRTDEGDVDVDALVPSAVVQQQADEDEDFLPRPFVDLVGPDQNTTTLADTPAGDDDVAPGSAAEDSMVADVVEAFQSSPTSRAEQKLLAICSNLSSGPLAVDELLFSHSGWRSPQIAVKLLIQINKHFQDEDEEKLTLPALYRNATITELSSEFGHLLKSEITEADPIFVIQREGEKPPLFLIHPATGLAHMYMSMRPYFSDRPVYGVNNPRFGMNQQERFKSLAEMAEEYADRICEVLGTRSSVCLGGWSFGGNLSLFIAEVLVKRRNKAVNLVVLCDAYNEWLETSAETLSLRDMMSFTKILTVAGVDPSIREELLHNMMLISCPPKYAGRVSLIKTRRVASPFEVMSQDPYGGFRGFLPRLEICTVPGNHYGMFYGETAESTASKIREVCDHVDSAAFVLQKSDISQMDSRCLLFVAAKNDVLLVTLMIRYLYEKHAEGLPEAVSAVDFRGRSALHWMAVHGASDCCLSLLRAGARKDLKDVDGATSVQLALEMGHNEVARLISSFSLEEEEEGEDGLSLSKWKALVGSSQME